MTPRERYYQERLDRQGRLLRAVLARLHHLELAQGQGNHALGAPPERCPDALCSEGVDLLEVYDILPGETAWKQDKEDA